MIILQLFLEFFKIGLFALGGGLATIPFLEHLSNKTAWFPLSLVSEMIAISEATPGPLGIKMATYVGFKVSGWLGGVIATLGVILPSIIIVIIVSKSLKRFQGSSLMEYAFYGLRPAVTGLIMAATLTIMQTSFIFVDSIDSLLSSNSISDILDIYKLVFFIILLLIMRKFRRHPVFYISISALVGMAFKF